MGEMSPYGAVGGGKDNQSFVTPFGSVGKKGGGEIKQMLAVNTEQEKGGGDRRTIFCHLC